MRRKRLPWLRSAARREGMVRVVRVVRGGASGESQRGRPRREGGGGEGGMGCGAAPASRACLSSAAAATRARPAAQAGGAPTRTCIAHRTRARARSSALPPHPQARARFRIRFRSYPAVRCCAALSVPTITHEARAGVRACGRAERGDKRRKAGPKVEAQCRVAAEAPAHAWCGARREGARRERARLV